MDTHTHTHFYDVLYFCVYEFWDPLYILQGIYVKDYMILSNQDQGKKL